MPFRHCSRGVSLEPADMTGSLLEPALHKQAQGDITKMILQQNCRSLSLVDEAQKICEPVTISSLHLRAPMLTVSAVILPGQYYYRNQR